MMPKVCLEVDKDIDNINFVKHFLNSSQALRVDR